MNTPDQQNPNVEWESLYRETKVPNFRHTWRRAEKIHTQRTTHVFHPVLAAALLIVLTLGIVAIVNKNEALPPEETFIADNTLEVC